MGGARRLAIVHGRLEPMGGDERSRKMRVWGVADRRIGSRPALGRGKVVDKLGPPSPPVFRVVALHMHHLYWGFWLRDPQRVISIKLVDIRIIVHISVFYVLLGFVTQENSEIF